MMTMGRHLTIVAAMAAVLSLGCSNDVGTPQFKITTKRNNDSVQVEVAKSKSIFSVHSPFGISQVIIERTDENWPDTVLLHLHLKGLEHFEVTNGKVTLEAAGAGPGERQWKDGMEDSPLNPRSPYWMETRVISKDEKPTNSIPLTDGYFEIQLPKALLEDNPKSITVSWIDFYR
jgi:hypothetical protein